jgi:hypothetical protein
MAREKNKNKHNKKDAWVVLDFYWKLINLFLSILSVVVLSLCRKMTIIQFKCNH